MTSPGCLKVPTQPSCHGYDMPVSASLKHPPSPMGTLQKVVLAGLSGSRRKTSQIHCPLSQLLTDHWSPHPQASAKLNCLLLSWRVSSADPQKAGQGSESGRVPSSNCWQLSEMNGILHTCVSISGATGKPSLPISWNRSECGTCL